MASELISVVIPSHFKSPYLGDVISSVFKQQALLSLEVIVVFNHVTEHQTADFRKTFKNVKFDHLPMAGVNRARNRGLSQAQGRYVFFFDDDCELTDPQLILKTVQIFKNRAGMTALGGGYHLSDKASVWDKIYNQIQMNWLNQTRYLIGGFFAVDKEKLDLQKIYFDENIVYGGSELSFFDRILQQQGHIKLLPFTVLHRTKENIFSFLRKGFKQGQGQGRLKKQKMNLDENIVPLVVESKWQQVLLTFWNFIFWLGHDLESDGLKAYLQRVFKYGQGRLLLMKYKTLDIINDVGSRKKSRGDQI